MAALRDAAMFLTRIPIHRNNDQAPNMGAAVPWFAAIGLILGLIQGGVYAGLHEISTPTVAAALSAALLAQITGAFHLDGLADMADAFGGGWTQEQRLEILKDSRLGTYGVTALIFVIIIEIAALSALAGWLAVAATVAAHTASRAVASFMMIIAKPAMRSLPTASPAFPAAHDPTPPIAITAKVAVGTQPVEMPEYSALATRKAAVHVHPAYSSHMWPRYP